MQFARKESQNMGNKKCQGFRLDKIDALRSFGWVDWILFAVCALFCYVNFCHGDILCTGNRSWLMWELGPLQFYEASYQWTGGYGANYMPSTFWLFALWNLPLKLLGCSAPTDIYYHNVIYVMWYKLLPVLVFLASGYLFYLLVKRLGMDSGKAKIAMFSFLTCPVAFYSQLIFSQYDVFTVFFMLWGMLYYFDEQDSNMWKFSLLFGIAITFKYFAALIFLLLLVLKEKNVLKMIMHAVILVIPFAVEYLLYKDSDAFMKAVMGFGVLEYVAAGDFVTGIGAASFSKILCVILLLWAYFTEPKDKNHHQQWAIYLCCGMCFVFFGLIRWHPQWLMLAAPFWTLALWNNKHTEKLLWLDIVFLPVFYAFTMNGWPQYLDEGILHNAIWKTVFFSHEWVGTAREYILPLDQSTLYSILIGIFLALFVFNHPRYARQDLAQCGDRSYIGLLRGRLIADVAFFAIPVGIWFLKTLLM